MSHDDSPTADRTANRRGVLQTLAGLGALGGSAGVAGATPGRRPGPKEHERLVGCAEGGDLAELRERVEAATPPGVSVTHENDTLGYLAVEFPSEAAAEHVFVPMLDRMTDVEYVEHNVTVETLLVPDDPLYSQQYAPQQVDAEDAWDVTLGSTDVTVAIVDSGVYYEHPNLADQFATDPGEDFADGDGDPAPDASDETHGTLVAGVASADTDNGAGMAGISDSRLLAARVLDESGSGSSADVADGIQWAADAGADVINLSLGSSQGSRTIRRAVEYAYEGNDVLVVAAAGNAGTEGLAFPARYDAAVGVTAVDSSENFASFSNFGPNAEIAAPGVSVVATAPPDTYRRVSGTSFSAPVVSGVAALGLAVAPELSAPELREALQATATDLGLPPEQQGAGQVDAGDLVASLADGDGGAENEAPTAVAEVDDASPTAGEAVTFDGSASSDPDGEIASYEWAFGDGETATGAVVEHAYADAGEYVATLTVTDDDGATATDSVTVTVEPAAGCTETASGSAQSALYGWWDSDRYQWSSRFEDTCEVTVTLDGPGGADFDLFVTGDGRSPTRSDYDAASTSPGADEAVTLEDVGDAVGILVDSVSGSGFYTVSVEEVGSGGASSQVATAVAGDDAADDGAAGGPTASADGSADDAALTRDDGSRVVRRRGRAVERRSD